MTDNAERGGNTITKVIKFGLIAGLASTIVMDLAMVGIFAIMGTPVGSFLALIGTTMLTLLGTTMVDPLPLGVALHYLIGLLTGILFGAVTSRVNALRTNTYKRGVTLGILVAQVEGIVLFLLMALILGMSLSEMGMIFGLGFVLHLIWGTVLGGVVSYGLR
ncbi:hypothetical protein ACFLTY_00440 [Chloroflexota bacterium]